MTYLGRGFLDCELSLGKPGLLRREKQAKTTSQVRPNLVTLQYYYVVFQRSGQVSGCLQYLYSVGLIARPESGLGLVTALHKVQ